MTNLEHKQIKAALLSVPYSTLTVQALAALDQAVEADNRRTRILSAVQEAMSQLRLDMKYLIFDLEATRRERDALREKYEK